VSKKYRLSPISGEGESMTEEAISSNEDQSWLDRTLKRNLRIDLEVYFRDFMISTHG